MRHSLAWRALNKLKRTYLGLLDDETYARTRYRWIYHRDLDLSSPRTFVDKMQWLKLNEDTRSYARYVDKYEVRSFVAATIGEKYLNGLHFVADDPDEITAAMLPECFALKATHGSGYNIIHDGTRPFDLPGAKRRLRRWFREDYSEKFRERQYAGITPRAICEHFMSDDSGSLRDYKLFCFGGEPRLVQVDVDRYTFHRRGLYRPDWTEIDATFNEYPRPLEPVPAPPNLAEMLECAAALSRGFRFVRVDFYSYRGRTIFGEMTFHPEMGFGRFAPDSYNYEFGDLIRIGGPGREAP